MLDSGLHYDLVKDRLSELERAVAASAERRRAGRHWFLAAVASFGSRAGHRLARIPAPPSPAGREC